MRVNGDRCSSDKHETSTTYQSHIYKSIDLQFGLSDYVTRFSNPAKFGEVRFSGGAPTWCWNIRVACILLLVFFIFVLPASGTSCPGAFRNDEWKKNTNYVTSHVHLKIAERIGETDGIKALDRNGKALKKEKCLSWVVSVSRDSKAQCRNEVNTDLVNRTERLKGDGKEMVIACSFNIFLFFAFGRRLKLLLSLLFLF